jgi:hypothetical protein
MREGEKEWRRERGMREGGGGDRGGETRLTFPKDPSPSNLIGSYLSIGMSRSFF